MEADDHQTSPATRVGDATNIKRLATHSIVNGRAACNPALMALFRGNNGPVTCKQCVRVGAVDRG